MLLFCQCSGNTFIGCSTNTIYYYLLHKSSCLNNPKVFYYGEITKFDSVNNKAYPIEKFIEKDGEIEEGNVYVPLQFFIDKFKLQSALQNDQVTLSGKSIINERNDTIFFNSQGVLFFKLEELAQIAKKRVFYVGEIMVITDREVMMDKDIEGHLRGMYSINMYPVIVGNERILGYNGTGVRYKIFSNNELLKEVVAGKPFNITVQGGGEYIDINVDSKPQMVGIGFCDFHPYPRKATALSNDSDVYKNIVKSVLNKKGIVDTPISIKQIFKVDIYVFARIECGYFCHIA